MRYFNILTISLGFVLAFCASAFIYMAYFGLHLPWIQTLFAILALWLWLTLKRDALIWGGFFTGILWFYWIGLSFRYYDLTWMIPFVILGIGAAYGLIFWLTGWLSYPALRAVAIGVLEWVQPFGFDWFRPALMFVNSIFEPNLPQLWLILALLVIFLFASGVHGVRRKWRWRYVLMGVILMGLGVYFFTPLHFAKKSTPDPYIHLVHTNLNQRDKWNPRYLNDIVEANINAIKSAQKDGYKAVVLPESAFPMFLNRHMDIVKELLNLSEKISIITGSLYWQNKNAFNSTYYFHDHHLKIMNKVVLVPFGESDPLPHWIAKYINKIFFDGASDYDTAKSPSDYMMLGKKWRNAICYEATSDRLYKGDPKRMIAISNNAWFTPSIEPTLQRLLLQMQSDRHHTIIYHATNGPITTIIKPK